MPITFEDAPVNQYAVKNTDYKVKCRVKADPSPSIDWKKDHKPINPSGKHFAYVQHRLHINLEKVLSLSLYASELLKRQMFSSIWSQKVVRDCLKRKAICSSVCFNQLHSHAFMEC